MGKDPQDSIAQHLPELVGKACWSVKAGKNTGSVLSMEFGRKIKLKRPLKNRSLTAEARLYRGEMKLFIECAWRLDGETGVVCGLNDAARFSDWMLNGIR